MRSNGGIKTKALMLAMGAFLLLPTATFAQDWRYGQDRRDERWERRDDRRRDGRR